jgi:hypothetical protein
MAVPRRLTLSLDRLAQQFEKPQPPRSFVLRQVGPLAGWETPRATEVQPGRWLTLLTFSQEFLVLVDEFRDTQVHPFAITLHSQRALRAVSRNIVAIHDRRESIAIHLLGDYAQHVARHRLSLTQKLAHGRFLLALTPDIQATVRGLNGWSVEFRSGGRVAHLLHSNRSGRLRALGPIQTDARFAAAEWPAAEGFAATSFGADVHLLGAQQMLWQKGKLTSTSPADLTLTRSG